MNYSKAVYDLIFFELDAPKPVKCQNLIGHLGLSPIPPNPQGKPRFSVDGAGLVDVFYRATTDKVHEIFRKPEYRTKDQLEQDAVRPTAQFIDDVTRPILLRFGSEIWNVSSTYTIKPLVYHALRDQEQIVAYVYCWIIARALRKLPSAKPRGTRNSKPKQSMPQSSASIEARRFDPRDALLVAPYLIQGPTFPGEGSSRAGIQHQQPPRPAGPASRKRRNSIAEHERIAGPMTLRRLGKQPVYSPAIERNSSSADASYPSPQEGSDDEEARCNFPNVPYRFDGSGGAGAGFITHGLPLTAEDLIDNQQSPNVDEDNDSVMGPVNEDQAPQATSQALVKLATQRAPGVEKPMLTTSHRDEPPPVQHTRLASELLEMLESCDPEHQDTATMQTTVVLIKQIRKADKERLVGAYGVNSEQYRTTLTMWLEAMDELIRIRTMLGFEGTKKERAELLKNFSDEQFKSTVKTLCDAIDKINQLRSADGFTVTKFSADLACIFIALIKWEQEHMRETYLEELLTEFNNRLLMWF